MHILTAILYVAVNTRVYRGMSGVPPTRLYSPDLSLGSGLYLLML
jgi:hypothetical protein